VYLIALFVVVGVTTAQTLVSPGAMVYCSTHGHRALFLVGFDSLVPLLLLWWNPFLRPALS
jgi:hypothetical protein